MRLGELLLQRGLITSEALQRCLKIQRVYGGRLGTNLVELGLIDSMTLAQVLASQHGADELRPTELESIPAEVVARLDRHLAETHTVVPISVEAGTLRLAMIDPSDQEAVAAVQAATGCRVRVVVGPELLVHYALERFYGVRPGPRFKAVHPQPPPAGQPPPSQAIDLGEAREGTSVRRSGRQRRAARSHKAPAARGQPPKSPSRSELFDFGFDFSAEAEVALGRPTPLPLPLTPAPQDGGAERGPPVSTATPPPLGSPSLGDCAPLPSGITPPAWGEGRDAPSEAEASDTMPSPVGPPEPGAKAPEVLADPQAYTLERLVADLVEATELERIWWALRDGLHAHLTRVAVLLIRNDLASGRCQAGCERPKPGGKDQQAIRRVELVVTQSVAMDKACHTRGPVIGPLPSGGGDALLGAILRAGGGEEVLVLPIRVGTRVGAIAVAAGPRAGCLDDHLEAYNLIAHKVSLALQMILLRRRLLD